MRLIDNRSKYYCSKENQPICTSLTVKIKGRIRCLTVKIKGRIRVCGAQHIRLWHPGLV
jgi:hypothetical protein